MPNPHFRVNHISRGANQNAVASAAYRAGETLYDYRSPLDAAAYQSGERLADDRRGEVFSFVRKEGILHTEIVAPRDAPEWARDREKLWNAVEHAEDSSTRRKSARLAVDFVGSLPRELSHDAHRLLVSRFVQDQFTRRGLVADVAFHEVKARDGGKNPHVHMMITTRAIGADGFGAKARWMDKRETLERWRTSWEHHTNRLLEAAGRDERLSLKSLEAQGIDQEPTRPLGYEASALEKKGIRTRQGDENRAIAARNAHREPREREVGSEAPARVVVTTRQEKMLRYTYHAARLVLGGNYQREAFHDDERDLLSAAQRALRGFENGKGDKAEHDAARTKLAPNLEKILRRAEGSLSTFASMADALEETKGLIASLRETPAVEETHADRNLALHARMMGADPRGPWFDSLSYDFGGGALDAARDAIHRYRLKDRDAEERKTTVDDEHDAEYAVRAARAKIAAEKPAEALAARASMDSETLYGGQSVVPSVTPRGYDPNTTERYTGINQDSNSDTPRNGPGMPPRGGGWKRKLEGPPPQKMDEPPQSNATEVTPAAATTAATTPPDAATTTPAPTTETTAEPLRDADYGARLGNVQKQALASTLQQNDATVKPETPKETSRARDVIDVSAQIAKKYARAQENETRQEQQQLKKGEREL